MTRIIDAIPDGHRLIFITPFDGRPNDNSVLVNATAVWLRTLPEQYPFITIADWNAVAPDHFGLLAGDTVHMGGIDAMNLYANLLDQAILAASEGPSKGD
jgi:hypothetical protein